MNLPFVIYIIKIYFGMRNSSMGLPCGTDQTTYRPISTLLRTCFVDPVIGLSENGKGG